MKEKQKHFYELRHTIERTEKPPDWSTKIVQEQICEQ